MPRLKTLQPRVTAMAKTSRLPEYTGWEAREQERGNRHQRGYGSKWDKLRIRILTRDKYLCQSCYRQGRPEPASEVDHVIPKSQGGTDDEHNLQSLCKACHRIKTARESRHSYPTR